MKKEKLHPIQLSVLKALMFSEGLRYSEIKPSKDMPNNHFQYYLDKLIVGKYIAKDGTLYALTDKGKIFVSNLEYATLDIVSQPKSHVSLCARRKANDEYEYLLYTRQKHPYFGCQGFPSGKISKGSPGPQEANRELLEETGLSGTPVLAAIFRHILTNPDDNLSAIDDLLLFVYIFDNPSGELTQTIEGEYEWVRRSQIKTFMQKPFISEEQFFLELDRIEKFDGKTVNFYEDRFDSVKSF